MKSKLMSLGRALLKSAAIALLTAAFSQTASALTAVDAGDTYTQTTLSGSNFGAAPTLLVSSSNRAWIRFNMNDFLPAGTPWAQVSKATLKLWVSSVSGTGSVNVYAVTGTSWSEWNLTDASAPSVSTIPGVTPLPVSSTSQGNFVTLDLTGAVQYWVSGSNNYGILIAPNDSNVNVAFDSKESTTTSHEPQLDIVLNSGATTVSQISGLSTVAISGSYADLIGKPLIPSSFAQLSGSQISLTSGSQSYGTALGLITGSSGQTFQVNQTITTSGTGKWQWLAATGTAGLITGTAANLDTAGRMTFFSGATNQIVIDPTTPKITINGVSVSTAVANTTNLALSGGAVSGGGLIAAGSNSKATATNAFAIGTSGTASGVASTALGNNTVAQGYAQTAIGQFNVPQGSGTNWQPTDDLFTVGNGLSGTSRSNAFVVKKNGNAVITGGLTVSGSGSIPAISGTGNLAMTGTISAAAFTGTFSASSLSGTVSASQISGLSTVATSGSYASLSGLPTIPTNTAQLTNDAGFVTAGGSVAYATTAGNAGTASALTGNIPSTQVTGLATVATAGNFASLLSTPTTLAGYGITDPVLFSTGSYADPAWLSALSYSKLTGAPTNLSAFANDAGYVISGGTAANLTLTGIANITGALVATGTANTLPNQTLSGGTSSILTLGLADHRYFQQSGSAGGDLTVTGNVSATNFSGNGSSLSGVLHGVGENVNFGNTTVTGSAGVTLTTGSQSFNTALGMIPGSSGQTLLVNQTLKSGTGKWQWLAATGTSGLVTGTAANLDTAGRMTFFSGSSNQIVIDPTTAKITINGSPVSTAAANTTNLTLSGGAVSGGGLIAAGANSKATGSNSFALGVGGTASGIASTALGNTTTAQGYAQTTIGQFNIPQGSGSTWVSTDDLFTVGNGTSGTSRSNAFVVKKNGNAVISGGLTVSGSGATPAISGNGNLAMTGTISAAAFSGTFSAANLSGTLQASQISGTLPSTVSIPGAQVTGTISNTQISGLGSAALVSTTTFATAAQGTLAASALQPTGDGSGLINITGANVIGTVANANQAMYDSNNNYLPSLFDGSGGSVAFANSTPYANYANYTNYADHADWAGALYQQFNDVWPQHGIGDIGTSDYPVGDIHGGTIYGNGSQLTGTASNLTTGEALSLTGSATTPMIVISGTAFYPHVSGGNLSWTGSGVTTSTTDYASNSNTAANLTGTISTAQIAGLSTVASTGNYSSLNGRPTTLSSFTNDPGYITSSGTVAYATTSGTALRLTGTIAGSQVSGTLATAVSLPANQVSAGTLPSTVSGASITGVLHGTGAETATFATVTITGTQNLSRLSMGGGQITTGGLIAAGTNSKASGTNAIALGVSTVASGTNAIALGVSTVASGTNAVAMGLGGTASGFASTALGNNTVAQGYAQTAIGQFNVPQGSGTAWVTTDDLFTVGNGLSGTSRSNAFVVKKNGNATISGTISAAAFSGTFAAANLTGTIAASQISGTLPSTVSILGAQVSGLATVATSGNYASLNGAPTKLSSFTNDPGYITSTGAAATITGTIQQSQVSGISPLLDLSGAGYNSSAYFSFGTDSVSFGNGANGSNLGAAVGQSSNGCNVGAAVGCRADGSVYGVAVGYGAYGYTYGVAVGYGANGSYVGAAVGYGANGSGLGNAAIGGDDTYSLPSSVPSGWIDTVELGRGTATLQGGLNFRGHGIVDSSGNVVAPVTGTVSANAFTGSNLLAPNQVYSGSTSILTAGIADTRYLRQSGSSGGNLSITGTVSATNFSGNGSSLSGVLHGTGENVTFGNTIVNGTSGVTLTTGSQSYGTALGLITGTSPTLLVNQTLKTGTGTGKWQWLAATGTNGIVTGTAANLDTLGRMTFFSGTNQILIDPTASKISINGVALGTGTGTVTSSTTSLSLASGQVTTGGLIAAGTNSKASGMNAIALGAATVASGTNAVAMGVSGTASGFASTALGNTTTAQGYAQTAIGQFNVPQGSGSTWVTTDDLFTVGNGTSAAAQSNAFVVKKNGNAVITGGLTVSGSGASPAISGTGNLSMTGTITAAAFSGTLSAANLSGPIAASQISGTLPATVSIPGAQVTGTISNTQISGLGSAALVSTTTFATATQGLLAASAVQSITPGTAITTSTSGQSVTVNFSNPGYQLSTGTVAKITGTIPQSQVSGISPQLDLSGNGYNSSAWFSFDANTVAFGRNANGSDSGAAIGYRAWGNYYGAAIGNSANGSWVGSAVGYNSNGSYNGAAVGEGSNGSYEGSAIGRWANGCWSGAAIGKNANGSYSGAAIGNSANGSASGAAIGNSANGSSAGAAIGNSSNASSFGAAIGSYANASGLGNVAVGGDDSGSLAALVPTDWQDTVELGRGTATLNGGLNFRGVGIADATGMLYAGGNGGGLQLTGSSMIVSGSSYPLSKLANVLSGNGTSNILPNQTLSGGAASILTQGLADGRYLPANTLSSGSTTVTGNLYVNSGDANFNGRLSLGPTGTAAGHGVYLNVNSGNNDTVANFQSTSGSGNQSRIVFSDNISCRYIGIVGSDFSIWNSSAGVRQFTVTDAGKVGIGTTTPGYALDVAGSINLTGTLYQNGVPFTSGGGSGGNWVATGSDATIVAGNVGIGTVTPQAALDVNGSVKLTGTTTLAGTVRVSGTNSAILINPQGDLLMGEFQSGPQPQ